MNKFLIISFIFIIACTNKVTFASSMSNQMFYVPSLSTQNMNVNISELTNDAMLYNFNFADQLNLIQRDETDNKSNEFSKEKIKYNNFQNDTKFETWRNNQQLLKEQNRLDNYRIDSPE